MIPIDHLTKRGRLAYFEIKLYLDEKDYEMALLQSIKDDIDKNKSFKINVKYWVDFNLYFTTSERTLLKSWISEFGLLALELAIWAIYFEYSAENFLHECGLYREIQEIKQYKE